MVDFLQNNKSTQAKKKDLPKADKTNKQSWLRGLLHPVNGAKAKDESIDLLATAKKQMAALSPAQARQSKKPARLRGTRSGVGVKPKADLNLLAKSESETKSPSKKLTTEGSKKISQGFDVNLLPATVRFKSTNKIITMLSLWLIVTLVVLGVIYVGISFYGQQVTEEGLALEAEIQYLDSEIVKFNSDVADASKWQVKLAAVDSLLRSHVYWTNFFSMLEMTTLPSVYYSGFTASLINSDINLSSYARSFTTVAKQLIAYERFPEVFSSFSVAEASLDEGIGISYNALVSLRRSLFYDQSFITRCQHTNECE